VEFLDKKDNKTLTMFSRLFLYYNTRAIEGTVNFDSGAYIRDTVKSFVKTGCCPETVWPYIINKFKKKPNQQSYNQAKPHMATVYSRINGLANMKACLASGYPFVYGFNVYESFLSQQVANTGIVPMPAPGESLMGGHAGLAVGYDDVSQRFTIQNSWGTGWGQNGFYTIPYAYLSNTNLASDFWVINRTKSE